MTAPASKHPKVENPFSARFVRPGAIPYIFPEGHSPESIFALFRDHRRQGAVVGPHGVGKSALLAALRGYLAEKNEPFLHLELHNGQRSLSPDDRTRLESLWEGTVLMDGYEQLHSWSRYQVRRLCRRRKLGLLVTAHSAVELPAIFTPEPSSDLAWRIVEYLLQQGEPLIAREDVEACFSRHGGNLREMLFELYDLYEIRLHPPAKPRINTGRADPET
ncbi:hypothetical protein [Thermopirellula anaerolimosa]